jgi:uncharacterized protein involved in exopolysaccharide biosynthesis
MDFYTALGVLRRRWLVLLIGLALTAAAVAALFSVVKPIYSAESDHLLLVKHQSVEVNGKKVPLNPYLNFQDGLTATAETMIEWLNSDQASREVETAGGSGILEASGFEGSAPLILLQVTGKTQDATLATSRLYAEELNTHLAAIQAEADAPKNQFITASDVQVPEQAQADQSSRIRAVFAVGLLGLLLTIFAAFTVERRSETKRSDRSAHRSA